MTINITCFDVRLERQLIPVSGILNNC